MPVIRTTGWLLDAAPTQRVLASTQLVLPLLVRRFHADRVGYCVATPAMRVGKAGWDMWVDLCRRNASYDPDNRFWVWSWRRLESLTVAVDAAESLGVLNSSRLVSQALSRKAAARAAWKDAQAERDRLALELSAKENVPESRWGEYAYPDHYKPQDPQPNALQRIIVSRYWNREGSLIGSSVGTGKSRMVVDIMSARALHPPLRDSARIILLIAPLTLHENWRQEWRKWTPLDFRTHLYRPGAATSWNAMDADASVLFEDGARPGGLIIICTPQALARPAFLDNLRSRNIHPTMIVVDEMHKVFRNVANKAFRTLLELRKGAHAAIALSGTPTNKFSDWYALEEFIGGGKVGYHWENAPLSDYVAAGEPATYRQSGFYRDGMSYDQLIQEYHARRIHAGHIFLADKMWYLKDSLPGLDQQELGEYADRRWSFSELVERFPKVVAEAVEFHRAADGGDLAKMTDRMQMVTLMLRMTQVAALSDANLEVLRDYVENILEPDEPSVIWTLYRNAPCEEMARVEAFLRDYGTVERIAGDLTGAHASADRQAVVDRLQSGKTRFVVAQSDAGGVGLNMTRPSKTLFLSIPLSYLNISQAIGRLHRIGQERDVTAYFAMTHPVTCFARQIYDRRSHVNEHLPTAYKLRL